jgi:NUMOD1 domain
MSASKGTTIYVYSNDGSTLLHFFPSANLAAKFLNCSRPTVMKYADTNKLLFGKYIISLNPY